MPVEKVHLIAAARPNFMKVAPLWHALRPSADFAPVPAGDLDGPVDQLLALRDAPPERVLVLLDLAGPLGLARLALRLVRHGSTVFC